VSYSDAVLLLCDCGWVIFIFIISFLITPTLKEVLNIAFFFFFSLMVSLQAKPDVFSCIHTHKPHHSGRGICALLPPKGELSSMSCGREYKKWITVG